MLTGRPGPEGGGSQVPQGESVPREHCSRNVPWAAKQHERSSWHAKGTRGKAHISSRSRAGWSETNLWTLAGANFLGKVFYELDAWSRSHQGST